MFDELRHVRPQKRRHVGAPDIRCVSAEPAMPIVDGNPVRRIDLNLIRFPIFAISSESARLGAVLSSFMAWRKNRHGRRIQHRSGGTDSSTVRQLDPWHIVRGDLRYDVRSYRGLGERHHYRHPSIAIFGRDEARGRDGDRGASAFLNGEWRPSSSEIR
jgi:hypothetical protein